MFTDRDCHVSFDPLHKVYRPWQDAYRWGYLLSTSRGQFGIDRIPLLMVMPNLNCDSSLSSRNRLSELFAEEVASTHTSVAEQVQERVFTQVFCCLLSQTLLGVGRLQALEWPTHCCNASLYLSRM